MDEFLLEPFGDAKAGFYKPSLRGKVKDFVFPHSKLSKEIHTLLDVETTILDISFYQESANFQIMKSVGTKGVIIRAGQNTWKDNKADIFMLQAKQAEMPFGSYWFYDSRSEPDKQAKLWSEILADDDTKLGIWADYEENYGGAHKGWRKFYDFLESCKKYMPNRKLGIYTGYYYWLEHSPNPITQLASLNYFGQYPLWLAWYTTDPTIVKIPKPWSKMTFWQYSASGDGVRYGVGSKEVDKNKFIGTYEEYNKMFNLGSDAPIPPPPTGEEGMYEVISTQYNMTLRANNSIFGTKVDTVPMNALMIADKVVPQSSGGVAGDLWAYIPSITINGISRSGWVAVVHNGVTYCTATPIQEPGTLPTLNITLEADGYPTKNIEWKPND